MQPLISVIIPAYNIEAYIGRCLDSVLAQTYEQLEIIVVDDGSKDNTGSIVDQYAKKDQRIRPIHKENAGVSAARNTGIDAATGELIGFVDGDDIIEKDMYEFLYHNMEQNDTDISHCGYQMVFPDRKDDYYGTGKLVQQDQEQGVRDLLQGTMVEPGLWNKLYKAELFSGIRLNTEIRMNEDLLMNYYLFKKAKKSVYQDEMKYYYMVRNNSATSTKNIHQIKDPIRVLQEMMRQESGENFEILMRRYLSVLTNVSVMKKSEVPAEFRAEKKQLKEELEKCFQEHQQLLSKKEVSQIRLAIKSPAMYRSMHYVYGTMTGSRNKYKVK